MDKLTEYFARIAAHVSSLSPQTRIVAACLAVLVVGGAVWLMAAGPSEPMTPLAGEMPSPQKLREIARRLDTDGVACRMEAGRLWARRADHKVVRSYLQDRESVEPTGVGAFENIAAGSDMWTTDAQSDRKWLVAKMTTLSRMVSAFPAVQSATVLMDGGRRRRLSRSGQSATAIVRVSLAPNATMTEPLACAIADTVAGAVSGMNRQDVRIVDHLGQSYRTDEVTSDQSQAFWRQRRWEDYYRRRISASLAYIDGATVQVRLEALSKAGGASPRCLGATVSIPQSYLHSAYRASKVARKQELFIAEQLVSIAERSAGAGDIADPRLVKVRWHYDVAAMASSLPANAGRSIKATVSAAVMLLAGLLAGAGLLWRRAGRKAGADNSRRKSNSSATNQHDQTGQGVFEFLRHEPADRLLALARTEHPQTTALMLANLDSDEAARILGGLDPDRQKVIISRIAAIEQIDPQVVAEIAAGLADRLGECKPARGGGVSAAARILNHAGYDAEKTVLDALYDDDPALAESIRRQMFEFDDIISLPEDRLGEVLAEAPAELLAVALRTAGRRVCDAVLDALGSEAARNVTEQMEQIGPVRLSDVEAAQQQLAAMVRRSVGGMYVADNADQHIMLEVR